MSVVERETYGLELLPDGSRARLTSAAGDELLVLPLLAALDRVDVLDETVSLAKPELSDGVITVERTSTAWGRAGTTLTCRSDAIEIRSWVEGAGLLDEALLLGGRSLVPELGTGAWATGSVFRTLFTPNPGDPARILRPAGESAVIGVCGSSRPGAGHWFFTPAPLFLALTQDEPSSPDDVSPRGWLTLGLAAPVVELGFVQLVYRAGDGAFALALEYEGHTRVEGRFEAPTIVVTPHVDEPYAGLRAHRRDLVRLGTAPEGRERDRPAWWSEPIFCGWGAQHRLGAANGGDPRLHSTQANYDAFLTSLARHGVEPGIVVVDDKWQDAYGLNNPDTRRWPDLSGWIAARHERGQRVLLWWKAWDPEGLDPELCVCNPQGVPVALDPTNPDARALLTSQIRRLLSPDGLDADGLKVDFTAMTPSGRGLSTYGSGWGIALLHELLKVVYEAAKEATADALVVTHTPHPAFVDVSDMIRLNDMLRLQDPGPAPDVVRQMRYRAGVARAACAELLIDTDDWCVPDRATWRAYLAAKPELGVPALYYVDDVDLAGQPLEEQDYEALRETWARWRERARA